MEIWDWRCEKCLELVPSDFVSGADGVAPDFWWKTLKNKKKKKLRYKGLIVVISSIDSLEVEPVAWFLQELTERGMPPCQDEGHWQGGMTKSGLLWEDSIPHYGLKGMG